MTAMSNQARFDIGEKLAARDDQRIIPFIGYIALNDRSAKAQSRALKILSKFDNEKADNYLLAAARRLTRPIARRALDYLIAHTNPGVKYKLRDIIQDKRFNSELQKRALVAYNKLTGAPIQIAKAKNFGHYFFPGLAGAFIGSNALQRLGTLGKSESGEGLGFFGGGLIGAGTGALLSDHFSRDDSLYYLNAAVWGLWGGALLNESIFDSSSESQSDKTRKATFELLGEITLIGGAFLAHSSLKPNIKDLITINAITLNSIIIALSALELSNQGVSDKVLSATLLGSQILGLSAGAYFAKDLSFTFGDLSLIGYGALETAFYAGIITDTFISNDKSFAAASLSFGLGAIGMTALSQYSDLSGADVAYIGASSIYGKLAGTALSLLANADDKTVTGAMLTGGLLGIVGASLTSDDTKFTTSQVILPPLATFVGLAHGAAIAAMIGPETSMSNEQIAGLILTTGTSFGLSSAYLSRQYEIRTWDVTMTSLGWVWGLWYSGWSIALSNADQFWLPLATVLTADLSAVATAYLIAPNGGNIAPQVVGWASLGGLGASAVAVLLTALYTSDANSLIISNLLGTTLGLGIGGYVAHQYFYAEGGGDKSKHPTSKSASVNTNSLINFLGLTASPHLDDSGHYDGFLVQSVFQLN